ncbi:MAG: hypothetical protein AAGH79_19435, partial [Bacteroidota bacterium]
KNCLGRNFHWFKLQSTDYEISLTTPFIQIKARKARSHRYKDEHVTTSWAKRTRQKFKNLD